MRTRNKLAIGCMAVAALIMSGIAARAADLRVQGNNSPMTLSSGSYSYGSVWISPEGSSGNGTLNIVDGVTVTCTTFYVGDGAPGTVNQMGGDVIVTGTTTGYGDRNRLNLGGWNAPYAKFYNLSGGTLTATAGVAAFGSDDCGTLVISGGTANLLGLRASWRNQGVLTLTGGTLNLGSYGFVLNDVNQQGYPTWRGSINLGHGTVKASASWSSGLPLILTGDGGGNVTFDPNGKTITLPTVLSSTGSGGLIVNATGGTGSLILSNANNTYAGTTNVNAGTLLMNGSLTGAGGDVTVAGGTLGGAGTINRAVNVNNLGHIAPGSGTGPTGAGTLTIANALSIGTGAILDFDLGTTTGSDLIDSVTNLSFGTARTLNVTPGSGFATGVAYSLVHYSGTDPSGYTADWTVTGAGAYTPTFSLSGSGSDKYLKVTFNPSSHHSTWNATGGGNWGDNHWDIGVPDGSSDTATFDSTYLTGNAEVALGAVRTVKSLTLDNATHQVTLSGTAEQTLKLQDADTLATVPVNVLAGSHLISAPVNLVNDVQVNTSADASLEISGKVTGSPLTKAGNGTLTLSGAGNDNEATTVTGGTLVVASAGALPSGKSLSIGSGGTLILGGGMAMGQAASAEPVPEPGTLALLAIAALAGVTIWRKRK